MESWNHQFFSSNKFGKIQRGLNWAFYFEQRSEYQRALKYYFKTEERIQKLAKREKKGIDVVHLQDLLQQVELHISSLKQHSIQFQTAKKNKSTRTRNKGKQARLILFWSVSTLFGDSKKQRTSCS